MADEDIRIGIKVVGGDDVLKVSNNMDKLGRSAEELDKTLRRSKVGAEASQMSTYEKSVRKSSETVSRHTLETKKLAAAQQSMGAVAQVAGRKMSGTGMAIQQTGYQVGDFLVQVQGGTNVLVAFGQQATQLVGVLPMVAGNLGLSMSAAIGLSASLGILIPLTTAIGAYFMRSGDSAKTFEQKVSDLDSALSAYESTSKAVTDANNNLENAYNGVNNTLDRTLTLLRDISAAKAQAALDDTARAVSDLMGIRGAGDVRQGVAEFFDLNIMFAFTDAARDAREVARDLSSEFVNAQHALKRSEGNATAQLAALNRLLQVTEALSDLDGERSLEEQLILETIANQVVAAEELVSLMQKNHPFVVALKDAMVDFKESISEAVVEAGTLGDRLLVAARSFMAVSLRAREARVRAATEAAESANYGGRGTSQGAGASAVERALLGMGGEDVTKPEKTPRGRSGATTKTPAELAAEAVAKLQDQLNVQRELVGATQAEAAVRQSLGDNFKNVSPKIVQGLQEQYAEVQKLIEIENQRQSIIDKVGSSMENSFMSMVDGTKSVKDAFKSMAAEIIKELYRVLVVQQIVNSAKTAMGGFFADGAAFSGGRVTPFANGGVVGGPTYFPMSGGKTGLMGEAGPEAIMPLKRGSDGKLGVSVEGGSGAVNVTNNINVTGGSDPAAIRMEVAKLMPQITSATKSAVIDARRRGGQMRAAFN